MSTVTITNSAAAEALQQSPQALLRRLRIQETDEEVVIVGKLPTYFLKQLAQETIRPVLGERRLVNLVVVD
jgi:hypothetical protein